MPGVDDLVDGLAGGSSVDSLVDSLAGDAPSPEGQITVGEPEVIKTQQRPGAPSPWYERLASSVMRPRVDQAAGQGLDAPLSDESLQAQAEVDAREAAARKHLMDLGSASGVTKKVAASLAGPFMAAGGSSIPANALNAGIQQTLQSAAEDDDRTALQNLESGGKAALTSAAMMKGGQLAQRGGEALMNSANKLRTHIFLTPGQRAAYKATKGPDALAKLGANARQAGLFKGGIGPATAGRVEENAARVMAEAGEGIGQFEDDLIKKGTNPTVDVSPIGENLRQNAEYLEARATAGTPAQAEAFRREAAAVQPMETTKRWLPGELKGTQTSFDFPAPEQSAQMSRVQAPAGTREPIVTPAPPLEPNPRALPGERPLVTPAAYAPEMRSLPGERPLVTPAAYAPEVRALPGSRPLVTPPAAAPRVLPSGDAPVPPSPEDLGVLVTPPPQGSFPRSALVTPPPAGAAPPKYPLATLGPDELATMPGTAAVGPSRAAVVEPPAPGTDLVRESAAGPLDTPTEFDFAAPEPKQLPAPAAPWRPEAGPAPVQEELGLRTPPNSRFEDITRPRVDRPFSEAIADKRELQNQIKWNKSAMQDSMGGEAARKASWQGHADQIDKALDDTAARGEIDPAALAEYRQNMQNFSTAATVHDPAMRMAQRQGQVGLGVADMLAATAAGDPGVALVSRAGRGRGAAIGSAIVETGAGALDTVGKTAEAAGRAVPAIGQALQNNPSGSKSDIERDANASTKKVLKGWWQYLTGK